MTESLFLRTVIAVLWDFDNTLIPGNMQKPLFKRFGVDEQEFFDEANGLESYYKGRGLQVSPEILYLNHILTYVGEGKFKGLDNALLKELGSDIEFHPGIPDFLGHLKKAVEQDAGYRDHDITVEHYVISTGLRQMILGSRIAGHVDDVWACEFVENPAPSGYSKSGVQHLMPLPAESPAGSPSAASTASEKEISQIVFQIDNTTKTRAVFEINKGANKNTEISVNATIPQESRRVPFRNMIYVADGPSDIPVFSILNQYGGSTFAVYDPNDDAHYANVYDLQEQGRVKSFGPADYTSGSHTFRWILHTAQRIADRIVSDRERALDETVQPPPTHVRVREESPETLEADDAAPDQGETA